MRGGPGVEVPRTVREGESGGERGGGVEEGGSGEREVSHRGGLPQLARVRVAAAGDGGEVHQLERRFGATRGRADQPRGVGGKHGDAQPPVPWVRAKG